MPMHVASCWISSQVAMSNAVVRHVTSSTRYIHPDHLGSTNAVTDQSGNLVQLMDYYPYGATRVSTSSYPTNEKRQYIGQFTDAQTNLNYLSARYYDSGRGQFVSVEPVILNLGDREQLKKLTQMDQQTLLTNPQLLNSYAYGRDNPILYKDPTGKFIPEAIVGGGIGGVVGAAIQAGYDFASGKVSSPGTYAGAFTGGATYGAIVGATDGASLLVTLAAGGASGAVQSATTQGIALADGSQTSFDATGLFTDTGIGVIGAGIPGARISGVTAGRGSYLAVQKQIYSKLGTGSLTPSQIALPTFSKMVVATGVQQAPGAAFQGVLANLSSILGRLSAILSTLTPTAPAKKSN
jgi:RHS repeat-associated protein